MNTASDGRSQSLPARVDIWQFSRLLTSRLLVWSGLSVLAGGILMAVGRPFWHSFGVQAVGWGAVDAAIALLGQRGTERRQAAGVDATLAAQEQSKLARLLWLNAGLDVLYLLGGLALIRGSGAATAGEQAASRRGHGWGIMAQATFLLLFDLWHGIAIRRMEER